LGCKLVSEQGRRHESPQDSDRNEDRGDPERDLFGARVARNLFRASAQLLYLGSHSSLRRAGQERNPTVTSQVSDKRSLACPEGMSMSRLQLHDQTVSRGAAIAVGIASIYIISMRVAMISLL